jgi:hypothetical protein
MLNDDIMFFTQIPSRNHYGHASYRSPYTRSFFERDLAQLEEEENRRRYEAALERQAYLEALERKRQQQRLIEERRQHLLELERRRRYEQEQEELRQYLAHLEEKRQESLNEERRRRAAASRKASKKAAQNAHQRGSQHIIRGPDGNLYRVLFDDNDTEKTKPRNNTTRGSANNFVNIEDASSYDEFPSRDKKVFLTADMTGSPPSRSVYPPVRNVTLHDCFNVNKNIDNQEKRLKAKKEDRRKSVPKSKILIGDVEDASDSECEDNFNDYWHTRRPRPGEWIEPVDFIDPKTHF